jgi:hypothetical protein
MALEFSRVTLPPLWTVEEAKVHLHLTGTAYDADVQQKLDAAQEAILAYLGPCADATWTAATAPKGITASIQLLLGYFYAERGDGLIKDPWPDIYNLLGPYRDPVIK